MNHLNMRSANVAFRAGLIGLLLVSVSVLPAFGKRDDAVSQAAKKDIAAGVPAPGIEEMKRIAEQAYVYGFPMIAAYKAMYEFNVDKTSPQFKAGFNQVWNDAKTFTPKDTAIPTPNADTPYSMIQADLRAEPLVFCVPEVEKGRYFSVQLADLYSFNYGYVGSRTTGNDAGCYLVAGPDWKGDKPEGIAKVFRSETQFSLIIFRTQLFNAADIDNVKKVQAGFRAQPLSAFLKQPAPPAAPAIAFPPFTGRPHSRPTSRPLSTSCCSSRPWCRKKRSCAPSSPASASARARPSTSTTSRLSRRRRWARRSRRVTRRSKSAATTSARTSTAGWSAPAFGDRAFFKGDYELRAAAAMAGIYGNDAAEAMYPLAKTDGTGARWTAASIATP